MDILIKIRRVFMLHSNSAPWRWPNRCVVIVVRGLRWRDSPSRMRTSTHRSTASLHVGTAVAISSISHDPLVLCN